MHPSLTRKPGHAPVWPAVRPGGRGCRRRRPFPKKKGGGGGERKKGEGGGEGERAAATARGPLPPPPPTTLPPPTEEEECSGRRGGGGGGAVAAVSPPTPTPTPNHRGVVGGGGGLPFLPLHAKNPLFLSHFPYLCLQQLGPALGQAVARSFQAGCRRQDRIPVGAARGGQVGAAGRATPPTAAAAAASQPKLSPGGRVSARAGVGAHTATPAAGRPCPRRFRPQRRRVRLVLACLCQARARGRPAARARRRRGPGLQLQPPDQGIAFSQVRRDGARRLEAGLCVKEGERCARDEEDEGSTPPLPPPPFFCFPASPSLSLPLPFVPPLRPASASIRPATPVAREQ